MVRSLGLVFAFVLLFLVIGPARQTIFPSGPNRTAVKTVDTARQVTAARQVASYAVLAPRGLPAGWHATSVRVDYAPTAGGSSATLRLGYVTPEQHFAGLAEGDAAGFVATELGKGAQPLPAADVSGEPWQQWRTAADELALSRTTGRRSVVVTGSATLEELRALAAALATG